MGTLAFGMSMVGWIWEKLKFILGSRSSGGFQPDPNLNQKFQIEVDISDPINKSDRV